MSATLEASLKRNIFFVLLVGLIGLPLTGAVPDDFTALRQLAAQGDAEAQCELGHRYYLGKGVKEDYTEATKWYLLSAEQGYAEAQCAMGNRYYLGKGIAPDYVKAYAWFDLAAAQGNENAAARLARILEEMTPAQIAEGKTLALEYARKPLRKDGAPANPAAAAPPLEEVQSLIDRGDFRAALDAANRLIARSPRDSEAHRLRANARRNLGDLAGALEDGNKAVELDPSNARALGGRAIIKQQLKDIPGAVADLDRALTVNPGYHQGYDSRASMRLAAGELAGALADSSRAIELSTPTAIYFIRRASIYKAMNNPTAASADLTRAIEIDPKATLAYAKRSLIRSDAGDLAGALDDLNRFMELGSPNSADLLRRAALRRGTKDLAGADQDLTKAIELDPANPQAYFQRGLVRLDQKRWDEAIADNTRAIDLKVPNIAGAYNNRGLAYKNSGKLAEARRDYEQALKIQPGNKAAAGNLARLDKMSGAVPAPDAAASEPAAGVIGDGDGHVPQSQKAIAYPSPDAELQKEWADLSTDIAFYNSNNGGVGNNGRSPSFTLQQPMNIYFGMSYHYNGGRGATPGTIAFRDSSGRTYGPWQTAGAYGNKYWIVRPGVTLPAGTYTIFDSDPATWSCNDQSGMNGMSLIKGRRSTPTPQTVTAGKVLATGKVGPDGGTIEAPGAVKVQFPAGAIFADDEVTITAATSGPGGGPTYSVSLKGGYRDFARPVIIEFPVPAGRMPSEYAPIQHIDTNLWVPLAFEAGTSTIKAKAYHFTDVEIVEAGRLQNMITRTWQTGAVALGGTLLVLQGTPLGVPCLLVGLTVTAVIGGAIGSYEFDEAVLNGLKGPMQIDGFDVYWDPTQFQPCGYLLSSKDGVPIMNKAEIKDLNHPLSGTDTIEVNRGGVGVRIPEADILVTPLPPQAILDLTVRLAGIRLWYEKFGLKTPKRIPVVVTTKIAAKNFGAWDKTYLAINVRTLDPKDELFEGLNSTLVHEYWHAIAYKNGYRESFPGSEDAVAIGLESLVLAGETAQEAQGKGFLTEYGWSIMWPSFKSGLLSNPPGETNEQHGYHTYAWVKYLYHVKGPAALVDFITKGYSQAQMQASWYDFAEHIFLRSRAGTDPVEITNMDGERRFTYSGLHTISFAYPGSNNFTFGLNQSLMLNPLSLHPYTLLLGPGPSGGASGDVIIRRVDPFEIQRSHAERIMVHADDQFKGSPNDLTGYGFVIIPEAWTTYKACDVLIAVRDAAPPSQEDGVLVYRLAPPKKLDVTKASAVGDNVNLTIKMPAADLGGVINPRGVLAGYLLFGRTRGGATEALADLLFEGDPPFGAQVPRYHGSTLAKGKLLLGSQELVATVTLPRETVERVAAFGAAAMDAVLTADGGPLASSIYFTGTSTQLTIDPSSFEATVAKPLGFTAKADSPPPGAKYTWKTSGKLVQGSDDKASVQFDKEGPATVTVELYDAAGKQIATATASGRATAEVAAGLLARLQTMRAVSVEIAANVKDGWSEAFPEGLQGMASEAKPVASMSWAGTHFSYTYEQHWKKEMGSAWVEETRLVEGMTTCTTDYSLTIAGDVSPDGRLVRTLTLSKRYTNASTKGGNDYRNCELSLRDVPLTYDDPTQPGILGFGTTATTAKKSVVSASASSGGVLIGVDSKYVDRDNKREIEYFKTTQPLYGTAGLIAPEKFTMVTIRFSDSRPATSK